MTALRARFGRFATLVAPAIVLATKRYSVGMNATHDRHLVKCPRCQQPIHVSMGRFAGGFNDHGGWVLSCSKCGQKFAFRVKNPSDASSVFAGATVIASWDDATDGDESRVLADHGLSAGDFVAGTLLIVSSDQCDALYDVTRRALYICPACHTDIDAAAYTILKTKLPALNSSLYQYVNSHLAGQAPRPDGVSVRTDLSCACGQKHRLRFYREFSEEPIQSEGELWLIDVGGALDVDGIYSRDDCIAILEKLLLRWRATHSAVLLATPFIGFDNNEELRRKIPALWNRVLNCVDPAKTLLITRKKTFKLFKNAASGDPATNVDFLKGWGLLNPMLTRLDDKDAFFKQNFHAKFYCGMSTDRVEMLVGSFNIHEGRYAENIQVRSYEYAEFVDRYILGMEMLFNPAVLRKQRRTVEIEIGRKDVRLVHQQGSLNSPELS